MKLESYYPDRVTGYKKTESLMSMLSRGISAMCSRTNPLHTETDDMCVCVCVQLSERLLPAAKTNHLVMESLSQCADSETR